MARMYVLNLLIFSQSRSTALVLHLQVPFRYESFSIFKVFVMMIGEMDYGNMFDDREGSTDRNVQVWYEIVTYMQFALFLIVMAILIMNLLVSDPCVRGYRHEIRSDIA